METVVLLAVLIGAVSADSHRDRRILLHSDVDIVQAIQSLKTDNVQMHKDIINLQSQNAQLQNNVSNHNSQLQGTVTQQQIENSQLRGNVSQLQGTVSRMQSHNSQLQGNVSQQQIENSQLRGNVSQLQGTVSRMQSQNSQLQGNISQQQIDNSQLRGNVSQLQGTVSSLQSQNSQLQTTVNHLQSANRGTGSSYVRWGRTICPANGTTLAYSGYMGGGKYDDSGSAVNHLCLTADPIWDHYEEQVESSGKVYGAEYEMDHHADGGAAFFGRNMHQQDAPCAVCHSPRSAAMMIPGRNQCYPGWTQEYSGYLVSGRTGQAAASEYICLDRRPESLPGGGTNDDDNGLYFVEGVCEKSLECPPYIDGRELTCVVCTK